MVYGLASSLGNDESQISIKPSESLKRNFHSLLAVNHVIRDAALQCLDLEICIDFQDDVEVFHSFATNIKLELLGRIKNARITFIARAAPGSFGTDFSYVFQNLKTLSIDLIPRDPAIGPTDHYNDPSRHAARIEEWSEHVPVYLSALHQIKGGTIRLHLRWRKDCEHFEKDYVGIHRWACVGGEIDSRNAEM